MIRGVRSAWPWLLAFACACIVFASARWAQENGSVIRPSASWTQRMISTARSMYVEVWRTRTSNSRRWSSRERPMKQIVPAMPPAI